MLCVTPAAFETTYRFREARPTVTGAPEFFNADSISVNGSELHAGSIPYVEDPIASSSVLLNGGAQSGLRISRACGRPLQTGWSGSRLSCGSLSLFKLLSIS